MAVSALDWNGKLSVVNGSPLSTPYPANRLFWAVTEEGEAVEVAYDATASFWLNKDTYSRQDGEPGHWSGDELAGWCDSQEDAEEAAELYLQVVA